MTETSHWRRLLPWIAVAAIAYLVLTTRGTGSALPPGRPAPEFRGRAVTGEAIDLAALRGNVVVLNFWASWCPPCRAEAPVLARAHAELARQGGTVVGVSLDDLPFDAIARQARHLGMTYPIVLGTPEIAQAYRATNLPTTYVVDASGIIRWAWVGETDDEDLGEAIRLASRPAM